MTTIAKFATLVAIEAAIGDLVKVANASQTLAHDLAVSCLEHVVNTGDVRPMEKLVNSIPKAMRAQALAVWVEKFSSKKLTLRWNEQLQTFKAKLTTGWGADAFDVEAADATPFYDLTKEVRPGKTKTIAELVKTLGAWANNDGTNDDGTPRVDPSAREAAAALLRQFEDAKPRLRAVA